MQLKSQDVFVGLFIIITSSVFRPLVSLRSIWWAAIARYGLHLYGHNRGSMIIQNAMGALHDDGAGDDVLAKTGVNFFEPAANAQKTAQRLNELSGGMQDTVILENHGYDFVGRVIGGNPATTHKIPEGSNAVREFLKCLFQKVALFTVALALLLHGIVKMIMANTTPLSLVQMV